MRVKSLSSSKNFFLNSLIKEDFKKVVPHLEIIEMPLEMPIHQPFSPITKVYFPETSVISIVTLLEDGSGVESGIIGRDSVSGIETILSNDVSSREAMVQLGGWGWRMDSERFEDFFNDSRTFAKAVLRCVYAFIGQISQNSVCLCHHPVDRRLARWLLMFSDRSDGNVLQLTQEFISMMIGVHRPTLSKSASKLQELNMIKYNRGKITILDRSTMEKYACECYKVIKRVSNT